MPGFCETVGALPGSLFEQNRSTQGARRRGAAAAGGAGAIAATAAGLFVDAVVTVVAVVAVVAVPAVLAVLAVLSAIALQGNGVVVLRVRHLRQIVTMRLRAPERRRRHGRKRCQQRKQEGEGSARHEPSVAQASDRIGTRCRQFDPPRSSIPGSSNELTERLAPDDHAGVVGRIHVREAPPRSPRRFVRRRRGSSLAGGGTARRSLGMVSLRACDDRRERPPPFPAAT